ncbi:hypothetical protein, partial [Escherichia coli]|uniref:hypothetical protein n=1 Tax=Escherichia coli TaxID=562 RepID=UPI00214F8811
LISESAWEEMTCLFAPSLTAPGFKVKLIFHHRPVSTATNRSLLAHRYNFVGNSSGKLFF